MKKKCIILTISLFALLLILNNYAPAQTTEEPPLTKEQIEAFRSAKIVRLGIKQSYGEAEGASFPFEKLIRKVFEGYTQCEVVGLYSPEYDLTIKINATGRAISRDYEGWINMTPNPPKRAIWTCYTGAALSGSIEFEIEGLPPYTGTFSQTASPPYVISDVVRRKPSKAPFKKLSYRYVSTLLEMAGEIYGIDFIIATHSERMGLAEGMSSWSVDFWGAAKEALMKIGDRAVEPMIAALNDEDKSVRRFAVEVLGKMKDPRAVEPLIVLLNDESEKVRMKVVEVLGEFKDPRAVEPLIRVLNDESVKVRMLAAEVLGEMGDPRAVEFLISSLRDEKPEVRVKAVEALAKIGHPSALEFLTAVLGDEKPEVRLKVVEIFGEMKDPRTVVPLIETLEDKSNKVRVASVKALGQMKDPRAAEYLIAKFKTRSKSLREAVIGALSEFKDTRTIELLIATLDDKNWLMRWRAAEVLGNIKDPRVFEPLIAYLKDEKNMFIKGGEVAKNILGNIEDPRVIEPLIAALKDADKGDQWWIVSTLKGLTGQDFDKNHEEWQKWWEENKEVFLKPKEEEKEEEKGKRGKIRK